MEWIERSKRDDLVQSKRDGVFDQEIIRILRELTDASVRDWCCGLVGESADRVALLEKASSW